MRLHGVVLHLRTGTLLLPYFQANTVTVPRIRGDRFLPNPNPPLLNSPPPSTRRETDGKHKDVSTVPQLRLMPLLFGNTSLPNSQYSHEKTADNFMNK
jgi:hypothetical protein